uniref:RVT_3 domain-containing protein n=1 Tax=Tanacetum cinerariifolium TaxID=118510 RepID=A0A6L2P650_TANCI|nr:RVT_3 domain-containing protein [Tanacetum cinerariifolium]
MLTAPKEKEELIIYPTAAKEAISAVLMTKRDEKQIPIYFVCRALQDGSSCIDGTGADLILTNLEGAKFTYALRFRFDTTNNEAEYEVLDAEPHDEDPPAITFKEEKLDTTSKSAVDPGENSSQSPPHIDHHCCYGCGNPLDSIFCQRCTCESCGNGAHIDYNFSPNVSIISNPEPCLNQNVDEFPQTLPSFHLTCYSGDENSFAYDSTPNFVNDSPNVFNPLPEPLTYSYEFCGNDAHYSHDCPPQDYTIAITFILSIEEPVDSLIMEDEHLDTTSITESDEVIKSSVEDLVPIPSEFEGIPDNMCDVPFRDNSPPLDISKEQFEDFSDSNNDSTSIDDDSFSIDDIDYVDASPPHSELISLEEVKDFHLEDGELEDDVLREKLSKINLLIAKIEALNANPTLSFDFVLKSPLSFLNSFFEETDTSDNSLPESEIFCFDIKEKNSGSTTIHADISLPDFDHFHFKIEHDPGELTSIVDSEIRENVLSATNVNLSPEDDQSPLFAYVVWIFLPFLTYLVAPPYLLSFGDEDTIFDLGIFIYHSFMPGVSHRSGTFLKFNVYPNLLNESPMEILSSTCFPLDQ